jgi:(2R)-3-sulfolactate dehydrogenase (NADP+)
MPAAGGRHPIFGTNPVAAVFPRRAADALMVDLSLSEVARGKVMVAAREGKPIPLGWALDREGNPTTDAKQALEGMMLPAGGVKGAMLALVVELLCCALTGAHMGFEADTFFKDEGNRPKIGQAFLVIDPEALAGRGVFDERVETLVTTMLLDPEVRLPGARRAALAERAARDGIEVAQPLIDQLKALAG